MPRPPASLSGQRNILEGIFCGAIRLSLSGRHTTHLPVRGHSAWRLHQQSLRLLPRAVSFVAQRLQRSPGFPVALPWPVRLQRTVKDLRLVTILPTQELHMRERRQPNIPS